jgi:ribosomal protein S18 acetylase RimI-like enzyme
VPDRTDASDRTDGSDRTPTYWKVPFEWDGGRSLTEKNAPDGVSWTTAEDDERLLGIVAQVLAASPDASDVAAVADRGAADAARHLLEAPPIWGMSRRPGWWTLLSIAGEPVGFVLPVTYDNSRRNGRDEATIFHMGVLPPFRGRGIGRALLRRATGTLLDHGVWRIYCDTAADNGPMIELFESERWHRLEAHQRPVSHLPAP